MKEDFEGKHLEVKKDIEKKWNRRNELKIRFNKKNGATKTKMV